MSKWYVTIDKQSSYIDDLGECVWTVSRDPNATGWCTDSGHPGYGLTRADAEELANAANEIDRLRAAECDWKPLAEEITHLRGEIERLRAAQIKVQLDMREKCAAICDEMAEYFSAYKDTALLNGNVELSIAASGEPRACMVLSKAIRRLSIKE